MPKPSDDSDSITSAKLTDLALSKAIDKVVALSNSSDEPETVAQLRSLAKKAVTAAQPFATHAKWVKENPAGQDGPKWDEVFDASQAIFDDASKTVYATDEGDVDIISAIEELAELVDLLRPFV